MAGILAGTTLAAGVGQRAGHLHTERPGSVLIFPKVVNTDRHDHPDHQHHATADLRALFLHERASASSGQPLWQVTDFELVLTRQQPTHWAASQGRAVNPLDDIRRTARLGSRSRPGAAGVAGVHRVPHLRRDRWWTARRRAATAEGRGDGRPGHRARRGPTTSASTTPIGIPACVAPEGAPAATPVAANDGDNVSSSTTSSTRAAPAACI